MERFDTVYERLNASRSWGGRKLNGIGYVLTKGDGIAFIDLDHCINGNGEIAPWALDVLDQMHSYAEVSPSGDGIHILIFGSLPANTKHTHPMGDDGKGKIEIYDDVRYSTVTGVQLSGYRADNPLVIEPRQRELDALLAKLKLVPPPTKSEKKSTGDTGLHRLSLSDRELIDRAMAAENGPKFARLWSGDAFDYDGDDSRADLGLLCMLAFWTGKDPARMDALFRQSGLFRDKWEQREDYRQRCIDRALEQTNQTFDPSRNGGRFSSQASSESPWSAAQAAPDFLRAEDTETEWLEFPFLAPGSISEFFSPRGLGKTHVALALAVRLGKAGKRGLLLDRDNSRREVRRRLKAWGAAEAAALKVLTRDEVPPLTESAKWATFPFNDFDFVIIDSLDASTEGVGEKDSSRPSRAIAPLLDIAHRANGPAILILGNTIKSGDHSRGSGIVEDRADICFEVRDGTDLKPTGEKAWWEELPAAGANEWAKRAVRRKRRDKYRLAFVPSKFRIGEEPEPKLLEIDLSGDVWSLNDVTEEVCQATNGARDEAQRKEAAMVSDIVESLLSKSRSVEMNKSEAEEYVKSRGVSRDRARRIIEEHSGKSWTFVQLNRPGKPRVLSATSLSQKESPAEIVDSANPRLTGVSEDSIFAGIDSQGPRDSTPLKLTIDKDSSSVGISAAQPMSEAFDI
jgi:hypothetical protein